MGIEPFLFYSAQLFAFIEVLKESFLKPARDRFPAFEQYYVPTVNLIAVVFGVLLAYLLELDIAGEFGYSVVKPFQFVLTGLALAAGDQVIHFVFDIVKGGAQVASSKGKLARAQLDQYKAADSGSAG